MFFWSLLSLFALLSPSSHRRVVEVVVIDAPADAEPDVEAEVNITIDVDVVGTSFPTVLHDRVNFLIWLTPR